MSLPAITVVLPVHNGQRFIRWAIESLMSQTFGDFELLVVDDGSTDESAQIVRSFTDSRIRLIGTKNLGLAAALNRGIAEARGKLVAIANDDDLNYPIRLERQLAFLRERPGVGMVGAAIVEIDEDGTILNEKHTFPLSHDELLRALMRARWVMSHPTMVFRRDLAIRAGLYDPAFGAAEDVDFIARFTRIAEVANMAEVLVQYRIRRGAISTVMRTNLRKKMRLVGAMKRREQQTGVYDYRPRERALASRTADSVRAVKSRRMLEAIYLARIGKALVEGRKFRLAIGKFWTAATTAAGLTEVRDAR
jgi:glycosyltransferase involved in cell wall biosynthesis